MSDIAKVIDMTKNTIDHEMGVDVKLAMTYLPMRNNYLTTVTVNSEDPKAVENLVLVHMLLTDPALGGSQPQMDTLLNSPVSDGKHFNLIYNGSPQNIVGRLLDVGLVDETSAKNALSQIEAFQREAPALAQTGQTTVAPQRNPEQQIPRR